MHNSDWIDGLMDIRDAPHLYQMNLNAEGGGSESGTHQTFIFEKGENNERHTFKPLSLKSDTSSQDSQFLFNGSFGPNSIK